MPGTDFTKASAGLGSIVRHFGRLPEHRGRSDGGHRADHPCMQTSGLDPASMSRIAVHHARIRFGVPPGAVWHWSTRSQSCELAAPPSAHGARARRLRRNSDGHALRKERKGPRAKPFTGRRSPARFEEGTLLRSDTSCRCDVVGQSTRDAAYELASMFLVRASDAAAQVGRPLRPSRGRSSRLHAPQPACWPPVRSALTFS